MHQTAPTTNNYLAQDVSSVFTAEKLWARDRPSDFKGASGTHGEERQSALTGPSVKTGIQEGRLLYREMRERSLPAKLSLYFLIHCLCLSSLSKKQVSFNSMAEVTIHSDFRVQENKIHFSPFYLPWSGGVKCHDLNYWMLSFKPAFSLSAFSSGGSLVPLHFLPLEWYHLHIWGCWYFSQQSWFQLVLHSAQNFAWCI